jgi:hypothetical protein
MADKLVVLTLGLFCFGLVNLGCPPPTHGDGDGDDDDDDDFVADDDSAADDDDTTAADDDDDDTTAADDDDDTTPADDDDDDDGTPEYVGEIDMANAMMNGQCTATVAHDPADPSVIGEGWFEFVLQIDGWARDCWIEFWDLTSNYCEGYDPATGDPCETGSYTRPGWDMDNALYGWDPVDGFWDRWDANIEYIDDLAQADAQGQSTFICEDAGSDFETWFCCCDDYTELCFCTEFNW